MVSFTQIALVAPLLLGAVTAAPLPSQAQDLAVRSETAVEARDFSLETREPKKHEPKTEDSETKSEEDSEKKVSKKHHKKAHGKKNSKSKVNKKSGSSKKLTVGSIFKTVSKLPKTMTVKEVMEKYPKATSKIESMTIEQLVGQLKQVRKLYIKTKGAKGKKAHARKNKKNKKHSKTEKRDEEMIEERDEELIDERDLGDLELAMLARDLDVIHEIEPRDIDAEYEIDVRDLDFDDELYI